MQLVEQVASQLFLEVERQRPQTTSVNLTSKFFPLSTTQPQPLTFHSKGKGAATDGGAAAAGAGAGGAKGLAALFGGANKDKREPEPHQ